MKCFCKCQTMSNIFLIVLDAEHFCHCTTNKYPPLLPLVSLSFSQDNSICRHANISLSLQKTHTLTV